MAVLQQIGYKKSLADLAYEEIKEAIVTNKFKPRQILAEEELARELVISRTPVRTALKRLECEQLIEGNTSKNMVVATMTPADLTNASQIRCALEPLAASLAAVRVSDAEMKSLRRLEQDHMAALDSGDFERFILCEYQFHTKIAALSANTLLVPMVERIEVFVRRALVLSGSLTQHWQTAVLEHSAIVDALAVHNAVAAEQAMRCHVENVTERMLQQ